MSRLKQEVVGAWVRRLRTEQRMSVRALASRSDFSPSFISQVEHGTVSPSIASMEKIATCLGVTIGEFFAAAAEGDAPQIVRARDRPQISSLWSKAMIESLGPTTAGRLEAFMIMLEPGGRSAKHPATHASEEFAYVVAGQPTLTLGPEEHALRAGDAVTVRPRELRLWENRASVTARILIVSLR